MKFAFKIFISVILIMVLTLSAGGYFLISTLFNDAIAREQTTAEKEHTLIQFSLETALSTINFPEEEDVISLAQTLETSGGNNLKLNIYTQQGAQIFGEATGESHQMPQEGNLVSVITDDHQIKQESQFVVGDQRMYLESLKDINFVFDQRNQNYVTFQKMMLVLIGANSVIIFLLAFFLTRPIQRLSKTARQIGAGDLEQRVTRIGSDEIGQLAIEFNRMAENLQQKITELEEANRRQDEFIGSFAHEIKTPLTSVIGYADLLRSKQLPPEKVFDYSNYIFQEGKRMEALSFKLMDIIVLQNKPLSKEWIPVLTLLEESNRFLMDRKVTVEAQPALIYGDQDLLKTLLFNLMDNARKATTESGEIHIVGQLHKQGYQLKISDTGRGIPKEDLNRITEAFVMVEKSRNRALGGVGLGLTLSKKIAALHDIQMRFESEPGQGATVLLLIPEVKPCR